MNISKEKLKQELLNIMEKNLGYPRIVWEDLADEILKKFDLKKKDLKGGEGI